MKDIVIARYKEDVSWIDNLDLSKFNPIIYNKGLPLETKYNCINLPNIGREAHTYIYHILEHYDNLCDYTIFVQGNPLEHCSDFFEAINTHEDMPIVFLAENMVSEDIRGWYEWYEKVPSGSPITYLINVAHEILRNETPSIVNFASGAQFIVTKEIIRNRSKTFYKYLFDKFQYDYLLPWHLERIWFYIFGFNNNNIIIKVNDV